MTLRRRRRRRRWPRAPRGARGSGRRRRRRARRPATRRRGTRGPNPDAAPHIRRQAVHAAAGHSQPLEDANGPRLRLWYWKAHDLDAVGLRAVREGVAPEFRHLSTGPAAPMMPRQEHADLLRREEAARLRVVVDERDRPLAELAGGPRKTVRVGAVHAKADDDVAVSQSLRLQRTKVRRDAVPALVCTRQEAPPERLARGLVHGRVRQAAGAAVTVADVDRVGLARHAVAATPQPDELLQVGIGGTNAGHGAARAGRARRVPYRRGVVRPRRGQHQPEFFHGCPFTSAIGCPSFSCKAARRFPSTRNAAMAGSRRGFTEYYLPRTTCADFAAVCACARTYRSRIR